MKLKLNNFLHHVKSKGRLFLFHRDLEDMSQSEGSEKARAKDSRHLFVNHVISFSVHDYTTPAVNHLAGGGAFLSPPHALHLSSVRWQGYQAFCHLWAVRPYILVNCIF
jgi:hypothetical protein